MSQRRSGRPASSPTSKVETGTVLVEPCCEPKGSVDPEPRRVRAHTGRRPRKRRCGSRFRVGRVTIRCGPKSSEGREGNSVRAPIEREPRGQFGAGPNRARAARAIRCGPQSSEGRDDKSLRAQIGRRTARASRTGSRSRARGSRGNHSCEHQASGRGGGMGRGPRHRRPRSEPNAT